MRRRWFCFLLLLAGGLTAPGAWAQQAPQPAVPAAAPAGADPSPVVSPVAAPAAPETSLNQLELQVKKDFDRFEKALFNVAEGLRKNEPDRAELLYRARSQSETQRLADEMAAIADLLEKKARKPGEEASALYGRAGERQEELIARLEALLKVLQSENERERIGKEIARIQDLLKDTNKIIGKQKDVRADTERGNRPGERLQGSQEGVEQDARKLADKIDRQDAERQGDKGKPSPAGKDDKGKDEKDKNGKPSDKGAEPGKEGADPSGKPSDSKPGEKKPGDSKPGDKDKPKTDPKDSDGKDPEKSDPKGTDPKMPPDKLEGESPDGKPSQGKPSGGKPMPGKPMPGKPMPGKPSESPMGEPQESKPGESQPQEQQDPAQDEGKTSGRKELEEARREMEQAIQELKKKSNENASKEQDEAIAFLEQMKAKLEEILRQLRQEEKDVYLAMLEARLQKMLRAQLKINTETTRLDKVEKAARGSQTAALSRDEGANAIDADKTLNLLKEEGSSVAFPEAVEQMRDNMRVVTGRLERADTGDTTQLIEQMIVEGLEEMLLAVQKEMEKGRQQKGQPQKGNQGGEENRELVEKLQELKMIRSLQNQVNRLTRQIGIQVDGEQATDPETIKLTEDLARRQRRIQEATYDLSKGKNK